MSNSAQTSNAAKSASEPSKNGEPSKDTQKPAVALEEDDEFEDFPVEDWTPEDTELPSGNAHLWEESWDDDDTSDDFSAQLKEEIKKVESAKK